MVGAVKVGTMPHWTATTSDSSTAYVTNEASNDLSVIDRGTQTVTGAAYVVTGSVNQACREAGTSPAVRQSLLSATSTGSGSAPGRPCCREF